MNMCVCVFMQYFYRCECDTWSVTLRVDCRLGLGRVLIVDWVWVEC